MLKVHEDQRAGPVIFRYRDMVEMIAAASARGREWYSYRLVCGRWPLLMSAVSRLSSPRPICLKTKRRFTSMVAVTSWAEEISW